MKKKTPYKNITECDPAVFAGYRVCISKRYRYYTKYISHGKYATKEETLQAAMRCRDWLREELDKGTAPDTIAKMLAEKTF